MQVADRPAEEREHPPLAVGDVLEVALEVADQPVHDQPGIDLAQLLGAALDDELRDVDRHVAAERPRARHRVEQRARLRCEPGPELDQLLGLGGCHDLGCSAVEDLALAAGRVVLGELRDAVEEARAAVVVEELGRKLLQRRLGEAVPDLGGDVVPGRAVQPVIDPDPRLGEQLGHAAHLNPEKICRRCG